MREFVRNLRITRFDYYVAAGCAGLVLFFSVALYLHMTRRVEASGEQIGIIRFRRNTAQRKYSSQVIWEPLDMEAPLYNRDSIRTGELSLAEIILNDGTRIELDENSMVVLNLGDEALDINFEYGSINARREEGETGGETALNIRSQDQTITVGAAGGSDIQLNRSEGEGLDVLVNRGEASVATSGGEARTIGQDERATLSDEGIQVQQVTLRPIGPANGQRFFPEGAQTNVRFSWQPTQGDRQLTFQLSRRRDFSDLVMSRTLAASSVDASLGDGDYYWRLTAQNPQTGATEESEVRKISVINNAPIRLFTPSNGQAFQYTTEAPFVNFSWSENSLADTYTLEVATDPGFRDVVQSREVRAQGTAIRLGGGDYFWRVRSRATIEGGATSSEPFRLRVTQRDEIPAPAPRHPTDGTRISSVYFEREGVNFNWERSNEIETVTLEIASDANFQNTIVTAQSRGNFTSVRNNLPLGTYFWRLRGTDSSGTLTAYSATARFEVGETERLRLSSPGPGASIDQLSMQNEGLALSWSRPDLFGTFEVLVSNNESFQPLIRSERVTGLSTRMRGLPNGTYYWKVRLIGNQNNTLTESEPRSFLVTDAFLPPTQQYPVANAQVDMSARNSLPFRWTRSAADAEYELRLARAGGGLVFETTTRATEFAFDDLGRLNEGGFTWAVRACRNRDGRRECTPYATQAFGIILNESLPPPEVTSPEEQFVIEEEQ